MKSMNTIRMEHLVLEQWPKLKKKAQGETDPERLIAILEEIDDLLFNMEMTIAALNGRTGPGGGVRDQGQRPTNRFSVRHRVIQKSGANEWISITAETESGPPNRSGDM